MVYILSGQLRRNEAKRVWLGMLEAQGASPPCMAHCALTSGVCRLGTWGLKGVTHCCSSAPSESDLWYVLICWPEQMCTEAILKLANQFLTLVLLGHFSKVCLAYLKRLALLSIPGSAHGLDCRVITEHSLCPWGQSHTMWHLGCVAYTLVSWPVLSLLAHENVSWVTS